MVSRTNIDRLSTKMDVLVMVLNQVIYFILLGARRRRKRSLVMHKKKRMILPFVPSKDGARRLKQLESLATALTTSKTEFSNELTYMPNMAPRSSNLARLEVGGIQVRKSFQMKFYYNHLVFCCSNFALLDFQGSAKGG
jgi:hypothetical protein